MKKIQHDLVRNCLPQTNLVSSSEGIIHLENNREASKFIMT